MRNFFLAALPIALLSQHAVAADDSCPAPVIEYVTVEANAATPSPTPAFFAEAVAYPTIAPRPTAETPPPHSENDTIYGPIACPNLDTSDPVNIVPAQNVSLYYGSSSSSDNGVINVTLSMNKPTVILEYINAVNHVDCTNDSVAVSFRDNSSYHDALQQWRSNNSSFVMVTNHMGDCDAEMERGFFLVDHLLTNSTNYTIVAAASKKQLDSVAHVGEFTFSSLPAASLTKRITLNPSASITIADALANDTVLLDISPYVKITADEAAFTSTITFSGYLNYNFWTFSLKQLYFDLDASFAADVELTASVGAAYSTSFKYAPADLSYSLVQVPGVLELGPGLAFGIGVDIAASAAVNVTAGLGISLPDGNVHVDVLDGNKTTSSGWTPTYSSHANITERAEIQIDPTASLTVQLAFKLLGGLIDLTSGITASPGFTNRFTLNAQQIVNGTITNGTVANGTVSQPSDGDKSTCDQGIGFKSDFLFSLSAFVTQWWNATLYSVDVPLFDKCYTWV